MKDVLQALQLLPDPLIAMGILISVEHPVVRAFDLSVLAIGLGFSSLFDVPTKGPVCEDFCVHILKYCTMSAGLVEIGTVGFHAYTEQASSTCSTHARVRGWLYYL